MPQPRQQQPIQPGSSRAVTADGRRSRRPGLVERARSIVVPLGVIAVLGLGVTACSGDGDRDHVSSSGTTAGHDEPATDDTTTSTARAGTATPDSTDSPSPTIGSPSADTPPTTLPQSNDVDVTTGVYWVRPAGDDGPRSVPGYDDPPTGPFPLLVYGSVTNDGREPVVDPVASVLWRTGSGDVHATTVASVRTPDGRPLAVLESGHSADVFAVVSGEAAATFGDLVPELVVTAR